MNSSRKSVVIVARYTIFLCVIALCPSQNAWGQNPGGQPSPVPNPVNVRVTNTSSEPVPVTGTINVGNLGSNPLPVTGNVNVSGSVSVTNHGSDPLLIRDADRSAKTPVQITGSCTDSTCLFGFLNYTVPAGKFLVIEQVSTRVITAEGVRGRLTIRTCLVLSECFSPANPPIEPSRDLRAPYYLNMTPPAGPWSGDITNAHALEKVTIYAGPETKVTLLGQRSTSISGSLSIFVSITGYLVDRL